MKARKDKEDRRVLKVPKALQNKQRKVFKECARVARARGATL
jgi:hypothetical protein